MDKIQPLINIPEYRDIYINLLYGLGWTLLNANNLDRAESCFNKVILEGFENEYDNRIYGLYWALSSIYERKNQIVLAKDCHKNCQEFLVKSYVHNHPEHAFYYDNFLVLRQAITQSENNNVANTEEYINNLCSLGALLHKVDNGEYMESLLTFYDAQRCAIENNLLKSRGLKECYDLLQSIIINYVPEPTKSELVKQLIETKLNYYDGVLSPDFIYDSFAASFYAIQQYEKAIEYLTIATEYIESHTPNNVKLKESYKRLVTVYLDLKTDSANVLAYQYLGKLKQIITEKDQEYYDWYLEENGCILRYLYRTDEAIDCFSNNLKYFKKKYGESSDMYISTLNQLALSYNVDSDDGSSFLLEAKKLIDKSKDVTDSTKRGVAINLARYYISKGEKEKAITELKTAETIDLSVFGELTPITLELKSICEE